MQAVADLGVKEKHLALDIHKHAKEYKDLLSTEDRLKQLEKCELVNVYPGKSERHYRITGEGKRFLRKTREEQMALLRKYLWRADIPKECRICKDTVKVSWFAGSYYCEKHLNAEPVEIPRVSRISSPLGWD